LNYKLTGMQELILCLGLMLAVMRGCEVQSCSHKLLRCIQALWNAWPIQIMQGYRLFRSVLTSSTRKPLIAVHSTYRNCSYLQKLVKKVNGSAHLNASVPRDASATLRASPHQITYKVPWMIPVSSMSCLFCTNNNDYISCELNCWQRWPQKL
jgi:hypothetical protein